MSSCFRSSRIFLLLIIICVKICSHTKAQVFTGSVVSENQTRNLFKVFLDNKSIVCKAVEIDLVVDSPDTLGYVDALISQFEHNFTELDTTAKIDFEVLAENIVKVTIFSEMIIQCSGLLFAIEFPAGIKLASKAGIIPVILLEEPPKELDLERREVGVQATVRQGRTLKVVNHFSSPVMIYMVSSTGVESIPMQMLVSQKTFDLSGLATGIYKFAAIPPGGKTIVHSFLLN